MAKLLKKKQLWGALIGVALLAFCVKDIRLSNLRDIADRIDPLYIFLALLASLGVMTFRALRWKVMISRKSPAPFIRAVTLYSAGQMINALMPALTGQVGRLFLFSRKQNLQKSFVFSTIVMEVLFDSISLIVFVLLASVVFPFPDEYRFIGYIIGGFTTAGLIILYMILHYRVGFEGWCRKRFRHRWPGMYVGLRKFVRSFTTGIELLKSSQHFISLVALSLLSWACHILAVYLLFHAFGFEVPFVGAAVVMIVNTLVLMIPITPGNAGTFEVAVSTSLAAFAVARGDAVLFALALHLVDLAPIVILGMIFFRVEQVSLRKVTAEHEDENILEKISEDGHFVEQEGTV